MKTGIAISNSISIDVGVVQGTALNGTIELKLTLFSTSEKFGSVAILYKQDMLDEWKRDMSILASNAKSINGNEMYGLPCSSNGSESRLIWNHKANGIASGSRCLIKTIVIPSLNVACASDEFTRIETVFKGGNRVIARGLSGKIVGTNLNGDYIVINANAISLIDRETLSTILSVEDSKMPVHAVGTDEEGLIVLYTDGTIREFDNQGVITEALDASGITSGSYGTIFQDKITKNLLVSGGDVPLVSELTWGNIDSGTVIWNYVGAPSLDTPTGAIYGENIDIILFCDYGNDNVILIDRSCVPQNITVLSSVSISGETLDLQKPIKLATSNGNIYVCEEIGRREFFGTTNYHPSMARSGLMNAAGMDSLGEFSGLCFLPIIRSIK